MMIKKTHKASKSGKIHLHEVYTNEVLFSWAAILDFLSHRLEEEILIKTNLLLFFYFSKLPMSVTSCISLSNLSLLKINLKHPDALESVKTLNLNAVKALCVAPASHM